MQELKTKCRASSCFPARAATSTPSAPLYPQLIKSESEKETAEDIVDFFSAARQPEVPSPPIFPPPHTLFPHHQFRMQHLPHLFRGGESSALPGEFSASLSNRAGSGFVPDSTGISLDSIANHTRSQLNQSALLQAPLRQLPGDGNNLVTVHSPWTPGDFRNLVKEFPNIREDPEKCRDELQTVIQCYNPSWADINQLLRAVIPSEVQQRLLAKAQWPPNDPGQGADLTRARESLVTAVPEICPRKTDWTKINNCKGESPADYLVG
ncbi:hypothetical protein G0U57_003193 [Chelydra serpentina]|uniref:Uncharacterized protein n=1 Tax=Chelydra serpentina TaxID=8475 RepID=A0A8T1S073_CHESE|nr:hypothetical protein G0U57_003193 [Chelydra serpentina]